MKRVDYRSRNIQDIVECPVCGYDCMINLNRYDEIMTDIACNHFKGKDGDKYLFKSVTDKSVEA